MKITVIGAGSTYSPELLLGLLQISSPERPEPLPLRELWLMDIDEERLQIVGGFIQRMAKARDASFSVHLTTDRAEAIRGASYVVTQLRVGGMEARRQDERLGMRYGLVGQETTGIGGFAKALRTIPVLLDVAREMERTAPTGILINFTNPSGLVTEALARHSSIQSFGLCNIPVGHYRRIAEKYQVSPKDVTLNYLGLNHLSWVAGVKVGERDVWPEVFGEWVAELRRQEHPQFPASFVETLGMIPSYYLRYFYMNKAVIAEQAAAEKTRAEEVMEIEQGLVDYYRDPANTEPPPGLMKRGGAYYSTAASELLASLNSGDGDIHILNTPHNGMVPGAPADWVFELPCQVADNRAIPLPTEPLPESIAGLLHVVKSYELLSVKAAVEGDREAALLALVTNPVGPGADQAEALLDELLRINAAYLPQFAAGGDA